MSIEVLCNKFRDVPRSIIIKTDAVRIGIKFTQAALEAAKGLDIQFKGFFVFSQDMARGAVISEKIPNFIVLKGDDTIIQTRLNPLSPYFIDWTGDKFVFCDETGGVEEVYFPPAPKWLSKTLEDGTPVQAIVATLGFDMVVGAPLTNYCDFWSTGEQCLFCDIVSHLKDKKTREEKAITWQKPEQYAKLLALAFVEKGYRHGIVSSGTILGKRDGKSETEWFCDFLNAIREEAGTNSQPILFQIEAKPKDEVKMLHETGIAVLCMNLEVWNERLFNIICPGKARTVGWETWINRMFEAVDIFGKGHVMSNFVTGVEMAQPFGFKDAREAVKSTLGGFGHLMQHGVLPKMDAWAIEPGSGLAGQQPPPLEYYIELGRGFMELRHKYNFTLPYRTLCRGCLTHCCAGDWEYFYQKKE